MSLLLLLSIPAHVQAQGALVNGGNHSGIITTNDPSDSWTFSANAGDSINLRLGTTNFSGKLQLFGPNGALLETVGSYPVNDDLIAYTATNSGTFTVLVSDVYGGETGTYGLTLQLVRAVQHVVLVMMENRSFDHLLGWLPGADGKQAGLSYNDKSGQAFATRSLAPYFQGCGCGDPDHSYEGGRVEYDSGACDGWMLTNDIFAIGYYRQQDLSFFSQVATNWTVCDRYFAAIMAETQPNRIYQHAAQTDSLTNRTTTSVTLPTIWDRLMRNNVTGRYYYGASTRGGSILTLWGLFKYGSISYGTSQFYQDCASGNLPAVSFVDPLFTSYNEALGLGDTSGNDDHPHSDIRNGEAFLASIYNAVVASPNWSNTVLIINFDEWGGFFDHVPPPVVQIEAAEQALGNDGRLGFRVPCLVISPWSRGGSVVREQFDHTSVLKLIENRWGLMPLTVRDANANDLADVLDFAHPNFAHPPQITVPAGPFGVLCQTVQATRQANGDVVVTWDTLCPKVQLQSAPTIFGPWSDVNVTDPPYVTTPPKIGGNYYRLRTK